ncbi:MAG: gram-negative pili assembly chaperone, N-terminal domain protein [Hyphomicrobiales bacterium]|jgi:fimbrial chaperone protein|nr:gram-negative pili assembly chaperone, N-terminal domain protein [Hyphomicrobiales bacterium]
MGFTFPPAGLPAALMTLVLILPGVQPASAASISVSPIRADVMEPGNSTSFTIKNDAARTVNIQVRIFKWSLANGADDYAETDDVVATPPVAAVPQGASATVRIVRTSRAPVKGEESYRLVVDEIPDANRVRNLGVNVALRYTIPVFFLSGEAAQPRLTWTVRSEKGKRMLVATNAGDKHLRISALKVGSTNVVPGLAGYVLGHSSKKWELPGGASGAISAESDAGRINASISQ